MNQHTKGRPSNEERFWSKVDKSPGHGPQGECWLWTAGINNWGYGTFKPKTGANNVGAHRYSYELANGAIQGELIVRHKCDNPGCVNPAHLMLGTHNDNMRDMSERGRTNGRDKTHCPQGHEYTDENTYFSKRETHQSRACKKCRAMKMIDSYHAKGRAFKDARNEKDRLRKALKAQG